MCSYGFITSTTVLLNGPASISPSSAVGSGEDDARVMHAVGAADQVAPAEPEPLVARQEDVSRLRDVRLRAARGSPSRG